MRAAVGAAVSARHEPDVYHRSGGAATVAPMGSSAVVVVGSLNVDHAIHVSRLPAVGATVAGSAYRMGPGGKGLNQAVAAARAGASVAMIGAVGDDPAGAGLIADLDREGIRRDGVAARAHEATGTALVTVAGDGSNTIVVASGANATLSAADVQRAWPTDPSVVVVQLEVPMAAVAAALAAGRRVGATTVLTPAPVPRAGLDDDLLALVDVLVANEGEASALAGSVGSDPGAMGEALRARGCATVVVTLGARGALVVDRLGTRRFPAFTVDAVDTTAAGDAFSGVLATGLAAGHHIDGAVRRATAAGALATLAAGAMSSLPYGDAIDRLVGDPPRA